LEKEKKDLNERLRIAAKRIDHIERAYRKDERPLLTQDYADQQAADRVTFEEVQKARIENSLATHTQAVASKKRLGRMQDEYKAHRTTLLAAREEEYKRLKSRAEKNLEEEKAKMRKAYVEQKEAEVRQREEVEAAALKAEEEHLRAEAGAYPTCPLYAPCSRAHGRTRGGGRGRGSAKTRRRRTAQRTAPRARPRAGCRG
jgi:translation initiation factor 3 subunit A